MQSGTPQTSWIWDPSALKWFWYDMQSDTFIYADRTRKFRPSDIPRAACRTNEDFQAYWSSLVQWPSSYGSPTEGSSYTHIPPSAYEHQGGFEAGGKRPASASHLSASATSGSIEEVTAGVDNVSLSRPSHHPSQQSTASGYQSRSNNQPNPQQFPSSPIAIPPHQLGQRSPLHPDQQEQSTRDYRSRLEQPVQSGFDRGGDGGNNPIGLSAVTPQVYLDSNQRRFVNVQHPSTGVRTYYQTAPVESITDPVFYQHGIRSTRMLLGTGQEGDEELLFEGFRVRERPKQFFTVGKVFFVLWVEPAGESSSKTVITNVQAGIIDGRYGERVFSKVRRFVVIRTGDNYCSALPIMTYGRQGVGKPGVNKSEHSIIYSGKVPPTPLPAELAKRGEEPMRPQAIRVDPDKPEDKLDPLSRIDYGKVHTIQHNIKVKSFGKVNVKSEGFLTQQFKSVWSKSSTDSVRSEVASSSRQNRDKSTTSSRPGTAGSTGHRSRGTLSTGSRSSYGKKESLQHQPIEEENSEEEGDEEDEEGEDEETDEDEDEDAQSPDSQAAAMERFIAKLVQRGYSRKQAIETIKAEIAKKKG